MVMVMGESEGSRRQEKGKKELLGVYDGKNLRCTEVAREIISMIWTTAPDGLWRRGGMPWGSCIYPCGSHEGIRQLHEHIYCINLNQFVITYSTLSIMPIGRSWASG